MPECLKIEIVQEIAIANPADMVNSTDNMAQENIKVNYTERNKP